MGNVSSRLEDNTVLVLKDQERFSIASLVITNSRRKVLLSVGADAFPASRVFAKREQPDENLIEYIQDPEPSTSASPPAFLLRLNNEDDLIFNFSFVVRQGKSSVSGTASPIDTFINGLTFAFASSSKDLDNLVTREFHADPNLHKNPNVALVGDITTGGSQSVQFDWTWKWRPPKSTEDRGGGWRNICSFVEYDQRAHKLETLATFIFWVQASQKVINSPQIPSPITGLKVPPRLRLPSSQSIQSGTSDSDIYEYLGPPSPLEPVDSTFATQEAMKLGVSCQRPGEDMSAVDDGPLFRATMKALEQKTGSMRIRMKKVLRKAEAAQVAQVDCNEAVTGFIEALREASASNANAVQPALEHYFEKIAKEILQYESQNTVQLQRTIIEPLSRLYNIEIKQAEAKKKDFEEESRDYYSYVSRYLGQRQDSLKEKKRNESDSKYQTKRRNFELKRFDYSSFMQDLHGGRKEQELLSHLTKYADLQAKSFLTTAKKVEEMTPQLEALIHEVREADKEFQFQRTEREEKRRTLEMSTKTYIEPEVANSNTMAPASSSGTIPSGHISDSELSGTDGSRNGLQYSSSTGSQHGSVVTPLLNTGGTSATPSSRPTSVNPVGSPDKFKGIRDLEERVYSPVGSTANSQQRKEGLLWALSRPGSHVDPKGLNKQAWHKFWIVLDQGRLSEYSNWKQKLDLHMEPIDLRMASVREARNAERRFCFEVITPQFKRVYQATSEEDMTSWINSVNNALQSAFEGRGTAQIVGASPGVDQSRHRNIGSVLTGKSSSYSGHNNHHHFSPSHGNTAGGSNVGRRTTVGARPTYIRTDSNSFEENPSKLLQLVREADQGNAWCADCGSNIKTEWVSINLGIVLCIECSGIHRSLGTHISKIRSLTLDTTSFTTDIVELLLLVGNRVSNMVWEARLDQSTKPLPSATRDQRLRFITSKYVDRAYVTPIASAISHYTSPDETLIASIKKNDVQAVLYALALKANPNAADRSRNTHSVFLALAAADPATPAGMSTPGASPNSRAAPKSPKGVAFPIAELLVQNGAVIPATLPAFPLSPSAQLYVDQKSGHDTLGELPNIRNVSVTNGHDRPDGGSKLQKRSIVGGRLAVRPIGN
ncbi:MAG: hypothetical protein L6R38_000297 [Xanthoria sp. 2 TBL-2021]|nr:MAG: hypothetical protein L6R38_000297 [Xanthoria sp. 2 TBL-2021]